MIRILEKMIRILEKMINFALVKSKNVRQPWGLTRTFDFVRRLCLCHSAIGNGHRSVSD